VTRVSAYLLVGIDVAFRMPKEVEMRFILLQLFTIGGVVGCVSPPTRVVYPASSDLQSVLGQVEREMEAGKVVNYDILDFNDFNKAKQKMIRAKEEAKREKALAALGEAQAYFDLAMAHATQAQLSTGIRDILDARSTAIRAGAPGFQEASLQLSLADDELRSNLRTLQRRPRGSALGISLQDDYAKIALRAQQDSKLDAASLKIERACKRGAVKYAANILQQAEFDLHDAEHAIATHPGNEKPSAEAIRKANRSAQLLVDVLDVINQAEGRLSEDVAAHLVRQGRTVSALDLSLTQDPGAR
jgi:hypothetical protein